MCDPVMNLVFGMAEFMPELTMEQYISEIYSQLKSKEYKLLRTISPTIRRLLKFMDGPVSPGGYEQCDDVPGFVNGYQEYSLLADDPAKICCESWFSRVHQGLKAIASIGTVTCANTFDLNYELHEFGDELYEIASPKQRSRSSIHGTSGRPTSHGDDRYDTKIQRGVAVPVHNKILP